MDIVAAVLAVVALTFSVIALRRTVGIRSQLHGAARSESRSQQSSGRRTSALLPTADPVVHRRTSVPPLDASDPADANTNESSTEAPTVSDAAMRISDELRLAVASSLRHVSVVRYDAFADVTGQMSFTAAILDDNGDGFVITSLHSRADSRTLLKGVSRGTGEGLSPEEQQAVDYATGADTP